MQYPYIGIHSYQVFDKGTIRETKLNSLYLHNLQSQIDNLQSSILSLSSELNSTRGELASTQRKLWPDMPRFLSFSTLEGTDAEGWRTYTGNAPFVYSLTDTDPADMDIGRSITGLSDGVFTAPMSGIYTFSHSSYHDGNNQRSVLLNGERAKIGKLRTPMTLMDPPPPHTHMFTSLSVTLFFLNCS